jgi:hypothetical protein
MLHRRHVVLQHGIGHVADEQVVLLMAVRQQVVVDIRGIRNHAPLIGVLETSVKYRVIGNHRGVSGYQKPTTGNQKPFIGVSETGRRESWRPIQAVANSYAQLNTIFNTYN